MRIEAYFRQIEKIIEACAVIQLSNVTYEKRGTHEGLIRGSSTSWMVLLSIYPHHKHDGGEDNVVPSAAPDLAAILQEIESLVQLP